MKNEQVKEKRFEITVEETRFEVFTVKAESMEEALKEIKEEYKHGDIWVDGEVEEAAIYGYDTETGELSEKEGL